ncbi:MAG: PhoH family protein [Ottowia sp.]|nr:PhoH family protein [Ottowia sp.]
MRPFTPPAAHTAMPPLPPAPDKRGAILTPKSIASTRAAKPAKAAPKAVAAKPATKAAPKTIAQPAPKAAPRRAAAEQKRLFVLDTNVLLHDPTALFRFQEHDIYLPLVVLEELDAHKKGATEVARNGRQSSRFLDALIGAAGTGADLAGGLPLDATGFADATGRLWLQTTLLDAPIPAALPTGKADNQILGVTAALAAQHAPRPVVLVSKDINMRVKARALGLLAEDYQSDRTLDDGDLLYSGALQLPLDFWERHGKNLQSWQDAGNTFYRVEVDDVSALHLNQFVWFEARGEQSLHARVVAIQGQSVTLRTLREYTHPKSSVWGVMARNREQNFALNLLMDPEIDFVTVAGIAGTGKTLLALAAGLTQVLDERRYSEIIMTRATVGVGEDIGFLPGTEQEKMQPWMGALDDNLEFLARGGSSGEAGQWGRAATQELIRSRIKIQSMNFMRGRTFLDKWVIIDEAQNLTPKQMKTLITRAGPGTKIVCMGNLAQIDTPYLSEGSSGLAYAVERFKGWSHSGHITLARGERSRLADWASEVL